MSDICTATSRCVQPFTRDHQAPGWLKRPAGSLWGQVRGSRAEPGASPPASASQPPAAGPRPPPGLPRPRPRRRPALTRLSGPSITSMGGGGCGHMGAEAACSPLPVPPALPGRRRRSAPGPAPPLSDISRQRARRRQGGRGLATAASTAALAPAPVVRGAPGGCGTPRGP